MIKVRYPRTCNVLAGALFMLLSSRFLISESWLRSLRVSAVFALIVGGIEVFRWWRARSQASETS